MGKESAYNAGDTGDVGLIPGLGRSPGGGHGSPLWYSCLEYPMDIGACSPWGHKESHMTKVTEYSWRREMTACRMVVAKLDKTTSRGNSPGCLNTNLKETYNVI